MVYYFENRVTTCIGLGCDYGLLFRKQGYNLYRLFCKSLGGGESEKHGLAIFNLFGKGDTLDAAYYFLLLCSCL